MPDQLTAFAAARESLTLFESTYEDIEVVAALLNEQYDPDGTPQDVVDVTFRLRGRPGMFQVHPYFTIDWQAQAFFLIGIKQAVVEAIYQGLASLDALPRGSTTGPPIPTPGVALPV